MHLTSADHHVSQACTELSLPMVPINNPGITPFAEAHSTLDQSGELCAGLLAAAGGFEPESHFLAAGLQRACDFTFFRLRNLLEAAHAACVKKGWCAGVDSSEGRVAHKWIL